MVDIYICMYVYYKSCVDECVVIAYFSAVHNIQAQKRTCIYIKSISYSS